ncbi:HAMP domain-containing histidine kinase [Paenibacillus sp. TRM 82003]|nr:HAMP domain-containing histidine kinase [Paenibacillus sp. TRM 82003]
MDKLVRRLVWQLLLEIGFSAVAALPILYITMIMANAARGDFPIVGGLINAVMFEFPLELLMLMTWFFYFIALLVLFQVRRFRYYAQMIRAVRHISEGHFDVQVPVKQPKDFGILASDINSLILELRRSLDDERRAEQSKNELITNVSHDLRTPLTSILGYLGLIDDDRYRDEVELRQYVAIANEKAKRLHVLINDLFEYTRMRGGAMPLRMTPLNLVELVGQLLVQHRLGLEEAGLDARLHAPVGSVPITGDPDKLVRVIENLLTNAMRYGRDGRRVDVSVTNSGTEAIVDVVNYGEPISSADLPYIFDRFYRADKSRTEGGDAVGSGVGASGAGGGSGLGLAIAKGIVEKHGGTIAAYSDARRTVFQVRLPLGAGIAPRDASAASSSFS